MMILQLAIYSHRFRILIYLFLNINKPYIVQSLFCSYPFFSAFQQCRNKHPRLPTKTSLHLRRKCYFSFDYVGNCFGVIFRLERSAAGHQLIDGDSKCPNINQLVVSSSFEHFRGSVVGCASEGQHISFDSSGGEFLADSKVDEDGFLFVLVVQYVLRFDVSVTNVMVVDVIEGFDELISYLFEVLSGNGSTCSVLIGIWSRSGQGRQSITKWHFQFYISKNKALQPITLGCCSFFMSMKFCFRKIICYRSNVKVFAANSLPDYLLQHLLTTPCAPQPIFSPILKWSLKREFDYSSDEVQLIESAESLSKRAYEKHALFLRFFCNLDSICRVALLMIGTALRVFLMLCSLRLRSAALLDYMIAIIKQPIQLWYDLLITYK